jgi:thiamine biosynthesis lipoprotein
VTPVRVGPAPGCSGISLDIDRSTVWLPADVGLDLGGIGKGYAADVVAAGLVARGARGACVAVGGDVRCSGRGPIGGSWEIDVEDPIAPDRTLFAHRIGDGAIVTSTRRLRRWRHGGRWRHHLIDPSTGEPAEGDVTAVVVADSTAWQAEGWAKAAFVAGAGALDLLDRAGRTAWIVHDDGRVVGSATARRGAYTEVA